MAAQTSGQTIVWPLGRRPSRRLLTAEQERDLAMRIEAGDVEARQIFVEANLRLVLSVARQHLGLGVSLGDLVQEGMIGLIQAVDHFDWRKGTRFSTCATLWIRQAIIRALPELRQGIRVPNGLVRQWQRRDALADNLAQQLQRHPTAHELADQLPDSVSSPRLAVKPPYTVSLDDGRPSEDGDRGSLLDALSDETADCPEQRALRRLAAQELGVLLGTLKPRDRLVLTLRFGLDGAHEHTLAEIALQLGLTRQRIRQIEAQALRRLRYELARRPALRELFTS